MLDSEPCKHNFIYLMFNIIQEFKNKKLAITIAAFLLNNACDMFIKTLCVLLVSIAYSEKHGVNLTISIPIMVMLVQLPFLFFSILGGKLADRFNRQILLRVANYFNIPIVILSSIGLYHDYGFLLIGSSILISMKQALLHPTLYGVLYFSEKEYSVKSHHTFTGLLYLSTIIGFLAALYFFNLLPALNLVVITIAIIGYGILILVDSPKTKIASYKVGFRFNIVSDILQSINHARKYEGSYLSILGIAWFWLLASVFTVQLYNITGEIFRGDIWVFMLIVSFMLIGFIAGAQFCKRHLLVSANALSYVPIAIFTITILMLDLYWTLTWYHPRSHIGGVHFFLSSLKNLKCLVNVTTSSIFAAIFVIPLYNNLQKTSPTSYKSRFIGVKNTIGATFVTIALAILIAAQYAGFKQHDVILLLAVANIFTSIYISQIIPHEVIKKIIKLFMMVAFRLEIRGLENYEEALQHKKFIIIANHASLFDHIILAVSLPDKFTFAIDTSMKLSWWMKPLCKLINIETVDAKNPISVKTLSDLVKDNKPVVIFPEGRITETGSLMKVYETPGIIADNTGAVFLPIRVDGLQYSYFSLAKGRFDIRLFPKITLNIQPVRKLEIDDNLSGRERRHSIGYAMHDIMADMMFTGTSVYSTLFEELVRASQTFGRKRDLASDINNVDVNYQKLIIGSFVMGSKLADTTKFKKPVGILLPNMSGTLVIFYALLCYGRVPAMLNYSTGERNLLSSCKTAKIHEVYTSRVFIKKGDLQYLIDALEKEGIKIHYLEDIRKKIGIIDKLVGFYKSFFAGHYYRNNIKVKGVRATAPGDAAVILFTSGSEGLPKGVVLSHANLIANMKQVTASIDLNPRDVLFNALPLFHSFGLLAGAVLPVMVGMKVFFYPSPLHYRVIPEVIYNNSATIFIGTDTFLSGYAKYAHPFDFFNVRYVLAGAERLKSETRKNWIDKFGIRLLEGYGATETSPALALTTPMHFKEGSVGRLLPNIEYKLAPVEGIKNGGKLVVRGPNIMIGYLRPENPGVIEPPVAEIESEKLEGWYDTGDVVEIDDEGFVKIVGRVKRFAKIAGEMVSLAMIEEVAKALWPEHLVAAINVPDDKKGEGVIIFTDNPNADKKELQKFISSHGHPELFVPKKVVILKEMPILGAGKINYVKLKEGIEP
jgi:acyl-[acyl-carrier-protein]-phospholipid O-acyltransferase/long-chain-fatty-acid--[acyl-carrier-protein] ligase